VVLEEEENRNSDDIDESEDAAIRDDDWSNSCFPRRLLIADRRSSVVVRDLAFIIVLGDLEQY
jgi:hypothetical protein